MDLAMGNEAILPSSGPYHSQHIYQSSLFWFKIITPKIQADIGKGPNTGNKKGALTSD